MSAAARDAALTRLWRDRPRDRFVRRSALVLVGLVAAAWISALDRVPSRGARATDFLGRLVPAPIRAGGSIDDALGWAGGLLTGGGLEGAVATLAIAVVASVLAMAVGSCLALPAARNLASAEPWLPAGRVPGRLSVAGWRVASLGVRLAQIFLRSIPEYVWAFLLLTALGAGAWPWPAILALALHNAGILGRLSAETVENTATRAVTAMRALGASRRAIVAFAVLPACFPRFLLYFFYRFEACVRDATVLGMLGTGSLGHWIDEAASRYAYDEMLFFILLGSGLVLGADLVSAVVRRVARGG